MFANVPKPGTFANMSKNFQGRTVGHLQHPTVENIIINEFKFFPEKQYESARSYELAPYELAEHPCISTSGMNYLNTDR